MEPHFDHGSDSVGLIVDGRLAQTFVDNCASNELAVWSWVGQRDETAVNSWTRTQTGLCVAAYMLPHNALPPVGVEMMPTDDYVARLVGNRPPVIRSGWDVYLVEDRLIYVKDQCSPEDADPTFFFHLDPVDVNDLPSHRKQYGFDNLDFAFTVYGFIEGGVCVARRELSDYSIVALRTGQFVLGEGRIWEGSFDVVEPADDGKAAP